MKRNVLAIAAFLVASMGVLAASTAFADRGGGGRSAERHWMASQDFRGGHRAQFLNHRRSSHWVWEDRRRFHGHGFHHPGFHHHPFQHHGFRRHGTHIHSGAVIFFGAPVVDWRREVWGSVLGGAAGGLLGSVIGRGAGNTAAIIGGTVLGAVVGGSVGRSMDDLDRLRVAQALENVPTRQALAWQNPDTENRYEVEPLGTFKDRDGRYCREFQAKALIAGESQQIYGTACRQPDGSWEVVP